MVAEAFNFILIIYSIYTYHDFKKSSYAMQNFMPSIGRNSSPGIDK
jgi:hypothetical protein